MIHSEYQWYIKLSVRFYFFTFDFLEYWLLGWFSLHKGCITWVAAQAGIALSWQLHSVLLALHSADSCTQFCWHCTQLTVALSFAGIALSWQLHSAGLAFRRSRVRSSLVAASLVICSPNCTAQYVELS